MKRLLCYLGLLVLFTMPAYAELSIQQMFQQTPKETAPQAATGMITVRGGVIRQMSYTSVRSGLVPTTTTVNGKTLTSNVNITAVDVGLGAVNNTSDLNKPVSTATQTALNTKQNTLGNAGTLTKITESGGQPLWNGNSWSVPFAAVTGQPSDNTLLGALIDSKVGTADIRLSDARLPLAHNQAISTITGLQTALDAKQPTLANAATLTKVSESAGVPTWNGGAWPGTNTTPIATTTTVGTVKPDGTTVTISGDGTITAIAAAAATSFASITGNPSDNTALNNALGTKVAASSLATVATTGSYGSLTGTPSLGTASAKNVAETGNAGATEVVLGSDTRLADARTPLGHTQAAGTITGLAAVATSGSYTDLTGKPTIPAAQVNSDWNAANGVAQIINKPTLAASATTDTTNATNIISGTLASTRGGAGTVNGILKADGVGTVSSAQAGTDYLLPNGSAAALTSFPTLNQNTTGTAAGLTTQYVDWAAVTGGASIKNKPTLAASAITDTTNATNISSGTLAAARGGAGAVSGIMKADGLGAVSAATAGTDYVIPSGSITGNAGTATALQTARSINGVSFNGTQDITIPTSGGITDLTGDVTASGSGSVAATLANTSVVAGTYTTANLTVDAKGRITAASNGGLSVEYQVDGGNGYVPSGGTVYVGTTYPPELDVTDVWFDSNATLTANVLGPVRYLVDTGSGYNPSGGAIYVGPAEPATITPSDLWIDSDSFGVVVNPVSCTGGQKVSSFDPITGNFTCTAPSIGVQEVDGSPSISATSTLRFPSNSLADNGNGVVTYSPVLQKCTVIKGTTDTDDYPLERFPFPITITGASIYPIGGTNVVGAFDECTGSGGACTSTLAVFSDVTATAAAVSASGSITNGAIDANNWVQWHTTSVSGTNTSLSVCFTYTRN